MTETSQAGMFALGTPSHGYLEFDAQEGAGPRLVTAIASLREPRTTIGGVNLVTGFRPDLWRAVAPDDAPPDLQGFDADLVGAEGYRMPCSASTTRPSARSRSSSASSQSPPACSRSA